LSQELQAGSSYKACTSMSWEWLPSQRVVALAGAAAATALALVFADDRYGVWSRFAVGGSLWAAVAACTFAVAAVQDGPLVARLVFWGFLPRGCARRRLRTALSLAELRAAAGGGFHLEVEGCVGDAEAPLLARTLERLLRRVAAADGGLETLVVTHCRRLSDVGLRRVLDAASAPTGAPPRELDLRGCGGLGDASAEALAPLLASGALGPLRLGLAACGLKAAGIGALAAAAGRSPGPAVPGFSAMDIMEALSGGPPAASVPSAETTAAPRPPPAPLSALAGTAGALREPRLADLELSSNALAGAGRSLSALVRCLPSLRTLSLESCALSLEDVQQLARSLPRSGLRRLDLAGNSLRSKGLLAVAHCLRMSQVEDLGLERNEIGIGEALAELKAAHDRRPFPTLRLGGNLLSESQEATFHRSLRAAPGKRFANYCPPGCNCFEGRGEVM